MILHFNTRIQYQCLVPMQEEMYSVMKFLAESLNTDVLVLVYGDTVVDWHAYISYNLVNKNDERRLNDLRL